MRAKLTKIVEESKPEELKEELFDEGYDLVMRDITRSLSQFKTHAAFISYISNSECIDSCFSPDLAGDKGNLGRVMARLRHLYQTTKPVAVVATAEGSRYTHNCMVGKELRGYAIADLFNFVFYDLAGRELLTIDSDSFKGGVEDSNFNSRVDRSVTAPNLSNKPPAGRSRMGSRASKTKAGSTGSVDVQKKRFSFSFSRSRTNSGAEKKTNAIPDAPVIGFLKPDEESQSYGPIALSQLKLWWKFHILKASTLICFDETQDNFIPVGDCESIFPQKHRVQMVDPTQTTMF
jgi:hypothetical protein